MTAFRSREVVYIGDTEGARLGVVWVAVSKRGLVAVEYGIPEDEFVESVRKRNKGEIVFDQEKTAQAAGQIVEFLSGERRRFDMPIDWSRMTAFKARALKQVFAIPYGETRSYGDIAAEIGQPRAARAVGRANATNPMSLVIPCHRVIGADGSLHGYGGVGGLETKAWLLALEQGNG